MIRFSLYCKREHRFEGWFGSNEDYEKQKNAGLVLCPVCGSSMIGKGLMAPHIAASSARRDAPLAAGGKEAGAPAGREEVLQKLLVLQKMHRRKLDVLHKLQALARKRRKNAENVGEKFAEEARKIHFGESADRAIYGRAGAKEVQALREDGIEVLPLPHLPEDNN